MNRRQIPTREQVELEGKEMCLILIVVILLRIRPYLHMKPLPMTVELFTALHMKVKAKALTALSPTTVQPV